MPEHAGKLGFYVNVADDQMRDPQHDLPTIGLLLVASSPLAVSIYDVGDLPADVQTVLPSEEDLTGVLNGSWTDEGDG